MNTLALLFPDVALIALGIALKRFSGWSDAAWDGLERLVYYVLFPALLFGSILKARFLDGPALPMLGVGLASIGVGIAIGYAARPVLGPPERLFASGVQCAFRFNTYIALGLSQRLAGLEGLALCSVLVGVVVPILNVAAVFPLARHSGSGLLRELARNPLVLATLSGLLGNFAGLSLPEPVDAAFQRLGAAAIAIGLLCVGAGLHLGRRRTGGESARAARRLTVWFTATKLLAMPLTALVVGRLIGLAPLPHQIVLMFASMPTAPAAYVLASRMGGDGPFVAWLISVSMIGALFALPLWMGILGP
ncbi:MAG: AEC family transporter [Burkholderiales bacterium]|nr:MAG: AEC family transporter [Burkholderiales bacterium]